MFGKSQKTVMEILAGAPHQPLSRYVEWLITVVVLVNCSAVILMRARSVRPRASGETAPPLRENR